MTDFNSETPPQPEPRIENLSLAALLGRLVTNPGGTLRALGQAADRNAPPQTAPDSELIETPELRAVQSEARVRRPRRIPAALSNEPSATQYIQVEKARPLTFAFEGPAVDTRALTVWALMFVLWALALLGGGMMTAGGRSRTDASLFPGILFLLGGGVGFLVLAARVVAFPRLPGLELPAILRRDTNGLLIRALIGSVALLLSAGAWTFNGRNQFTDIGILFWIVSIVAWVVTFMPREGALRGLQRAGAVALSLPGRVLTFRLSATLVIMAIILAAGFYFRFAALDAYPPDMTSDHVEKARDAQAIWEGYRPVFLPNNGGREVAHFYFLALLKELTGLPSDFVLLKIATGIEGLLGILAAWWLGRAFFKDEDPAFANAVGLIAAGLIAVSYWQIMLSRLGLRIVLTPLLISLQFIFFSRALRYNRRWDYILTGLLLGAGMYCYQALRIAPILIVIGVFLALVLRARSWRTARSYLLNFVVIVVVALAVFAPLGRYMIEQPGAFWSRTSGRLFGEALIDVTDPVTGIVSKRPSEPTDKLAALQNNMRFFFTNLQRSLLMFNFHGDTAWVTGNSSAAPELDTITGALFILGLGAWLVRMFRRRDPADWAVPCGIVVMLFPTALSLAYTTEVPSATRASGALPFVYLLAGFAAVLILRQAWRALRAPLLRIAIVAGVALIAYNIAAQNTYTYFTLAMTEYRNSTLPHQQAGNILHGFENGLGAPGNAFMIAYPYWWDHRALAIDAGDIHWNNGVLADDLQQRLIQMIKQNIGTPYAFRTNRQVLFFLNTAANESLATLQALIPNLTVIRVPSFSPVKDFLVATAPPVGCDWYAQNIAGVVLPPECAQSPVSVPAQ